MRYQQFSQYIAGIYRRSKNDFNRQIAELDVRATQSDLLMFIHDHPGYQQNQIAKTMSVDPGLLVRDLNVLARKGWVTRTISKTDHRVKVISLTDAGEHIAQELIQAMTDWWQSLFSELDDFDVSRFSRDMSQIYNQLLERDQS